MITIHIITWIILLFALILSIVNYKKIKKLTIQFHWYEAERHFEKYGDVQIEALRRNQELS
jgi:uncharacterized membrane protein